MLAAQNIGVGNIVVVAFLGVFVLHCLGDFCEIKMLVRNVKI